MAVGKGAYLLIDAFVVSDHAVSVANNFSPEEVDATVLSSQFRVFEPSYSRNVLTAVLRWNPTVQTFVDTHSTDGASATYLNLAYSYGPGGNQAGDTKISGTCNVVAVAKIPGSVPGQLTTLEVRFNLNTAVTGVYP